MTKTSSAQRRTGELVLIVIASLVTSGAYVLATLGRLAEIPPDIGPFLAIVVGLLFIAHVVNRFLVPRADGVLLPIAGLLNGLGYVFIARLDEAAARRQAVWTFLGIAIYILTLLVVKRSRDLNAYRYTFGACALIFLALPSLFGETINGSRIWISLGPVNFQPGEFAKLALAIFFAGYVIDKRELLASGVWRLGPIRLPHPRHAGPLLAAWAVSVAIMGLQRDLGTSLLFFMLFLFTLWVGTQRLVYLGFGVTLFIVGAIASWQRFGHVQTRVQGWLAPWEDPLGQSFQVVEAQFGLASGGITGAGPGRGYPQRVPAAHTDFIFSTIGEELGLLGATAVLMAFVVMIGAGFRAAIAAPEGFSKLLATGLTGLIGIQAFIIIAGVIRVLPLTGVTLPFVSYGGSSLLANYALLAILMRISDEEMRPSP